MNRLGPALAATVATIAVGPVAADEAYTRYLAGGCAGCHLESGMGQGIPPLLGLPEADFVAAMRAYQTGERDHPLMQSIAGRLDEAEIEALAAYYAAQGEDQDQ